MGAENISARLMLVGNRRNPIYCSYLYLPASCDMGYRRNALGRGFEYGEGLRKIAIDTSAVSPVEVTRQPSRHQGRQRDGERVVVVYQCRKREWPKNRKGKCLRFPLPTF